MALLTWAILQPGTFTALRLQVACNPIFLDFVEDLAHRSKFCGRMTYFSLNQILVSMCFLKETETYILIFLQVLFLTFAKEADRIGF